MLLFYTLIINYQKEKENNPIANNCKKKKRIKYLGINLTKEVKDLRLNEVPIKTSMIFLTEL